MTPARAAVAARWTRPHWPRRQRSSAMDGCLPHGRVPLWSGVMVRQRGPVGRPGNSKGPRHLWIHTQTAFQWLGQAERWCFSDPAPARNRVVPQRGTGRHAAPEAEHRQVAWETIDMSSSLEWGSTPRPPAGRSRMAAFAGQAKQACPGILCPESSASSPPRGERGHRLRQFLGGFSGPESLGARAGGVPSISNGRDNPKRSISWGSDPKSICSP